MQKINTKFEMDEIRRHYETIKNIMDVFEPDKIILSDVSNLIKLECSLNWMRDDVVRLLALKKVNDVNEKLNNL